MSFLGRLGLVSVAAVEAAHGQVYVEEGDIKPDKGDVFKHPQTGIGAEDRNYYIDYDDVSGLLSVEFLRVDEEGDVILGDYDCPDCEDDGGCKHCALDHADVSDILSKDLWAKVNSDKLVKLPGGSLTIDNDGDLRLRMEHQCKKDDDTFVAITGCKFILASDQTPGLNKFAFGTDTKQIVHCGMFLAGGVVNFLHPKLSPQDIKEPLQYYHLAKA